MFPFSVRFTRTLKAVITPDNQLQILQYIEKFIQQHKADHVVIEEMNVKYKGSTSNWRGSLFGSVDDGTFELLYKDSGSLLTYRINMRTLFITTSLMSAFMGIFMFAGGGPWWVGIIAFLWLCGANWIIILIRHDAKVTEIAAGINELICGKEPIVEIDKMNGPLKSWF